MSFEREVCPSIAIEVRRFRDSGELGPREKGQQFATELSNEEDEGGDEIELRRGKEV